ncbi:MAG: DUF928 domain-containing protein [Cyanobacteria bacterium J06649_4]
MFTASLVTSPVASLANPLAISAVWAQTYQPPEGDPPSGPYISNGSRTSCSEQLALPLTALVPTGHVGQTTSTTPSLVGFVPASAPYRIGLSVYRVTGEDTPEFVTQTEYVETGERAPGIVSFTLPTEESSLQPGQRYLWEVSLACQPDSPLYDQSFVAEIAIASPDTALDTALTTALAGASTPRQTAEIYAREGYWYDALPAALQISDPTERNQVLNSLLTELAELENDLQRERLLEISASLANFDGASADQANPDGTSANKASAEG